MAGNFYNENDPIEISELASLNEDISDDFIDKLQSQISNGVNSLAEENRENSTDNDDSKLFEEPAQIQSAEKSENKEEKTEDNSEADSGNVNSNVEQPADETAKEQSVNVSFDDNFIKKYKAKLNKKAKDALQSGADVTGQATTKYISEQDDEPIETLSNGNITERPLTHDLKKYNESLDFLDGNVKYSKYVIYIDPNNVDFIETLTVKERKNLINSILRQQDDISITKQRFALIQTVIRQVIIAVLTISISIPIVYIAINASLEATIDNHRRSQTNWQALYKQHGKITQNN